MKNNLLKSFVVFVVVAFSNSGYAQGNHYYTNNVLTDPYGNFQATFPIEPAYSYQDIATAVGNVRMYLFVYETNDVAYMVSYVDYPADMVANADKDVLLKGALNGYLNSLNLKLSSEMKINYENHPGLMFYGDDGQKYTVLRDYMVNNRLYQLAILQMGKIDVRDENDFFDSFVLIK